MPSWPVSSMLDESIQPHTLLLFVDENLKRSWRSSGVAPGLVRAICSMWPRVSIGKVEKVGHILDDRRK